MQYSPPAAPSWAHRDSESSALQSSASVQARVQYPLAGPPLPKYSSLLACRQRAPPAQSASTAQRAPTMPLPARPELPQSQASKRPSSAHVCCPVQSASSVQLRLSPGAHSRMAPAPASLAGAAAAAGSAPASGAIRAAGSAGASPPDGAPGVDAQPMLAAALPTNALDRRPNERSRAPSAESKSCKAGGIDRRVSRKAQRGATPSLGQGDAPRDATVVSVTALDGRVDRRRFVRWARPRSSETSVARANEMTASPQHFGHLESGARGRAQYTSMSSTQISKSMGVDAGNVSPKAWNCRPSSSSGSKALKPGTSADQGTSKLCHSSLVASGKCG
jgi:hypothetical protein